MRREYGDEATALDGVFSLFALTRETLKKYGGEASEFAKIAIVVLNQVVRPFTAKWHRRSLDEGFESRRVCTEFRGDLQELQAVLQQYTKLLSDMAMVEDLTALEETEVTSEEDI